MATLIFIHVSNRQVMICRYRPNHHGTFIREVATNNTELAPEALKAVKEQVGEHMIDGDYLCPPELAALAQWRTGP